MGENIGAAARGMLNFGLTDLRLVRPRDGWPNPKAEDMAKYAKSVVDNAQVFDSLEEAIHDVHKLYATTARPRDMVKPVYTPRKTVQEIQQVANQNLRSALVFGPERTGLSNEDITLADAITVIPVSPVYPSINLAQAVNIVCYEWFQCQDNTPDVQIDTGRYDLAPKQDILQFFEHLESELDKNNFFRLPEKRHKMLQNIRNLFLRAQLTDQDVRTLRGLIKSLTNT